jgi:DNA-binding NarL/FixJ family response regulator
VRCYWVATRGCRSPCSRTEAGAPTKEVGDELKLAEKTVKNYVSSILSKLEVARRAEAAAYLARHTTMPGSIQ